MSGQVAFMRGSLPAGAVGVLAPVCASAATATRTATTAAAGSADTAVRSGELEQVVLVVGGRVLGVHPVRESVRQAGWGLGLEMSTAIRQRPSASRFHSVRYRTVVTCSALASMTVPRR